MTRRLDLTLRSCWRYRSTLEPKVARSNIWTTRVAPKGTPQPVIQRMNDAIAETLKSPEVVKANAAMSLNRLPSTPQEFRAFITQESAKWTERVRVSGAKPQ